MLAMPMRWLRRSARIGTLATLALAACRGCEQPSAGTGDDALPVHAMPASTTKPEAPVPAELPGAEVIALAVRELARSYDPVHGGFGTGRKTPQPARLGLLARYARRTGDATAVRMIDETLRHMALGKIHDPDRGFHAYSEDAAWERPGGDETLAANAQIALAYLEAYQLTGFDGFVRVARGTLDFLGSELARSEGGFYTTAAARTRDEKLATVGNALAISAFARAGFVLDDAEYTARARATAEFWLDGARRHDGRMQASFTHGWAPDPGRLADQALMVQALLDVAEASAEVTFLREALVLQSVQDVQFYDPARGGYFDVGAGPEATSHEKPIVDGEAPSGNAIAISNLIRIATLTRRADARFHAEQSLRLFGPEMQRDGSKLPRMLSALCDDLDSGRVIVVVRRAVTSGLDIAAAARALYLPSDAVLLMHEPIGAEWTALVPALLEKHASGSEAVAHVCVDRDCGTPIRKPEAFAQALRITQPLLPQLPPPLALPSAPPAPVAR
jgi:uncharacterized protein YyaL (SSP411 family)